MSNTSEPLHPIPPTPLVMPSLTIQANPLVLVHPFTMIFQVVLIIFNAYCSQWGCHGVPLIIGLLALKGGVKVSRVWLYMCNTIDLQLCSSVFQLLRKSVATCATPWVHEATLLLQGFGVWHWWPLGPLNFPLLQLNEEKLDVTSKICWVKLVASLAALKWNCEKH